MCFFPSEHPTKPETAATPAANDASFTNFLRVIIDVLLFRSGDRRLLQFVTKGILPKRVPEVNVSTPALL
jgi:hypothetical protein